MSIRIGRPAAGLASLFFAWAGEAAAATGTLTAQAVVSTNCTISTVAVAFGAYDPILTNQAADLPASGSVGVACVKGSLPTIGLGLGTNASGSTRRMKHQSSPTEFLAYELYFPSSTTPGAPCTYPGTTVWGTSGANLFSPPAAPDKNSRVFNVCGTVPAGQNVEFGSYSDTVLATVTF